MHRIKYPMAETARTVKKNEYLLCTLIFSFNLQDVLKRNCKKKSLKTENDHAFCHKLVLLKQNYLFPAYCWNFCSL
jgi:hypothetical protein